jgi:protein O-mannosyl-transferase
MFAAARARKPARDWPGEDSSATSRAMGRKARDKKARVSTVPAVVAGAPAAPEGEIAARRPPQPPMPRRPRERLLDAGWPLVMLGLVAVTVVTYLGGLDTPFLLDDPINITKNPKLQQPLGLLALLRDPRAVVTASLHANWALGRDSVTGYHALNVAAHALAACLVFALAQVTLALPVLGGRYRRTGPWLATVIALVFALHPIQTESVTYVIQRSEVFAGAALVASLLAFATMREDASRGALAALAAACALGTYSKPSFVVVPALLAAYDLCFLARGSLGEMRRRWPAYAIAAAAAACTLALTTQTGALDAKGPNSTAGFDMEGITPAGYLAAQPGIIVQYLRVSLWPASLCFDCGYRGPWPVLSTFLGDSVAIPVAILAALAAAAAAAWKRHPLLSFAVLGSAIVLSPTSSFLPLADFYVEHRMYLPLAFVAMALVPAASDGLGALASRFSLPEGAERLLQGAAAATVLVALAVLTMARNHLLGDPIALMEDALRQAPQNERVHYNLANALRRVNRADEALPHYEEAIRLQPHVVRSYENLGSMYLEQGRLDDALRVFVAGAEAKPDAAMAHRNVANCYLRMGRSEEALASAETALKLEPNNPNGRRIAGDALLQMGKRSEAIAAYRKGLAVSPGDKTLKERLEKAEGR